MPEGAHVGQPIRLRPWQKDIIHGIYGSPTRRAIITFGRKNGKTSLSAALLLLHLVGPEARHNSQLFSAAQSRDQASLLFNLATKMVRLDPDLREYVMVRDTAKQLLCQELGTVYRALSADATTAYGLSPVFVVHDEIGQVRGPRSELYEALETACGAQDSPLSILISTQAPTDADLLSVLIDDAAAGHDPKTKLWSFSAPDDIDPFSVRAIKAANPAYGDFLNAEEVRAQADAAKRMPAREAAYRNLILNQRVTMVSPFIARSVWEACAGDVSDEAFETGPVYLGLDLSARNDLTAAVALAQDAEGVWHCKPEFFVPAQGLGDRAARDRAPYDVWTQRGHLTLTPGASVDYEFVAQWLIDFCARYPVEAIAYDRWRIDVLQAALSKLGATLPLHPFGQGYKDMAPAVDLFEGALLNGKFRHPRNPCLTWCAANAVAIADPAGNRKLDKSKSNGRIDGIVAAVMALGRTSAEQAGPSVYEERGIRSL